jgi:hypothetical protein
VVEVLYSIRNRPDRALQLTRPAMSVSGSSLPTQAGRPLSFDCSAKVSLPTLRLPSETR